MGSSRRSPSRQRSPEGLFRQVADAAPLMVWTADRRGLVTFASKNWLIFTGRTLAAECGNRWTMRVHPDDRKAVLGTRRTAVDQGRPFAVEYRYPRADGEFRVINDCGLPRKNRRGRVLGYIGSRVDITDRKDSVGALAEADARFKRLAENAQDIVYRYRFLPTRGTEYINSAATVLTGHRPEEFYADPSLALKHVHPDDRAKVQHALEQPPSFKEPFVIRWVHPDGRVVVLEHRRAPVFDSAGNLIGVEGIARDITQHVRHEEAMRRSEDQLRHLAATLHAAREAERAHLARELHDELGQTLTSLKLELLRMVKTVDRTHLVPIIDRIQSLIGLTEISLETTRRIATDLRPPTLDHLGLAEAIRWEASVVQARTGIRCRSLLRADTLELPEEQAIGIFRIFQEAITNVIRHAEASAVRITLDSHDRTLVLSVRDNGRGITAGQAADPAAIGLVGMRERARLLGGTLDIAGKQGKGTSVVFRLPSSARSEAAVDRHAYSAR